MPQALTVQQAIPELVDAFHNSANAHVPGMPAASEAFFFLVGAGVSAPQVPLAGAIQRECRTIAEARDRELPNEVPDGPMGAYAHWLKLAHPQPIQRQQYFRGLIERAPISAANLRLAHLLTTGVGPRLVVTPNFDDFLSRALTLFGEPHTISDHPATAGRIDPERSGDIQILHIHGTFLFYDCCNLQGEILNRARIEPIHQTVASRLDHVLVRRSPIVIGYSGWEQDVFMTALRRRLDAGPLAYNMYWFCHRRDDVNGLPSFLRDRDDVCFVLPPEGDPIGQSDDGGTRGRSGGEPSPSRLVPSADAERVGERAGRLDAATIFDEFIRVFDVDAPAMTKNPVGFFAKQLRASLPLAVDGAPRFADIYGFESTIERLDALSVEWDGDGALGDDAERAGALLEQIRDAVRRSQYGEAITVGVSISLAELSDAQMAELCDTLLLAAVGLDDNSEDEIAAYDVVVAAYDALADDADPEHAARVRNKAAIALVNRGICLAALARSDEAIAVYRMVVARFADDGDELELRLQCARALVNLGGRLAATGDLEQAVAAYQEAVERFGDDGDDEVRTRAAMALVNKGNRLLDLGRRADGLATYADAVDRYADDRAGGARAQAAMALVNRAVTVGDAGEYEPALAAYEEVIARFAQDADERVRRQVAQALVGRGFRLETLGRQSDAIPVYEEVVRTFANDPKMADLVTLAYVNQGDAASLLGEPERAVGIYEQAVRFAGPSPGSRLRDALALALVGWHRSLEALGRGDEAAKVAETINRSFGDRVASRHQLAQALLWGARGFVETGAREHAAAYFDEVVQRFSDDPDASLRAVAEGAQRERDSLAG